jgi:hypothetical protein
MAMRRSGQEDLESKRRFLKKARKNFFVPLVPGV